MLENNNHSQLELFSRRKDETLAEKKRIFNFSFLTQVRAYEKILLLAFAFIIISIAVFSIGVNRGKQLALLSRTESPVAQKTKSLPGVSENAQPVKTPAPPKDVWKTDSQVAPLSSEKFTVQLASYSATKSAEKEASLLKKQGFSPLIITKGKYIILCVGNFSQQREAKSLLAEFTKEKRYQGCYVRRL